jgi:hypothetical protein
VTDGGLTDHEKVGHYVEMWKQSVQVQMHFNDIEWRIRGLALTALTFALGAAAVSAKDGTTFGGVSLGAIVLAIGLLLWYSFYYVDRYWYHPLLKASVGYGSRLEDAIKEVLPDAGLTRAISAGSPYAPMKIFGRPYRKTDLHSDNKLDRFYFLGAAAIVLLAAALQIAALLTDPQDAAQPDAPQHAPTSLHK